MVAIIIRFFNVKTAREKTEEENHWQQKELNSDILCTKPVVLSPDDYVAVQEFREYINTCPSRRTLKSVYSLS